MQFTQVPNQHAPVGGALLYAVHAARRMTVAVTVAQAVCGATLGRKRFVGVSGAQFDIAPYVRRVVKFEPRVARTGVYAPEGRVVEVVVEADEVVESEAQNRIAAGGGNGVEVGKTTADRLPEKAVAAARVFLPGMHAVAAPALLTEMPRHRLIGPQQADELTLLVAEPCGVAVTAAVGAETVVARFELAHPGVHLFRLDMRDFPEAQTVRVDAGACGVVEYVVVPPPEGARRVAWRSRAGSLEHYTFAEETTTVVEAQKSRAYGAEGYVAAVREAWRMELASAYEERKVLEALSGILSSPQVWLASAGGYKAVDVLSERSAVYRNGVMSRMELVLRPTHKTRLPWS